MSKQKRGFKKLPGVLSNGLALAMVLLVALAGLALWLLDPLVMQSLRLAQFDQFQRWQPRPYTAAPVRVVDIDEASLKAVGQWPWPRTRVAELVQRLGDAGAAAIAFDVLLAEPDRTSPEAMAQLWQNPQVTALLQRLPDHDEVLAGTLMERRVVLGSALSRGAGASAPLTPASAPPPPYRIVSSGAGDLARWLHGFDTAVMPLPVLADSAAGLGALNFASDGDGVVRRVPLMLRLGDKIVPTLSAEALRVAQGARNHLLRGTAAGVQDVRIGAITVPTNARAEIWLHYTEDNADRYISAAQVLADKLAARQLDGYIVLIGSSAAGLMDLRFNPMGHLMPGVQAHALALEQILSGQYLQRPAWAGAVEMLVLVLGALLIGLVALGTSVLWSALAALALVGALGGGAWYAFAVEHLLLDAINPALAIAISFGLASGVHHLVSEREQRWLRDAFSRYVSPNRVAHLVAHHEQLQLGGQRQLCSFIFTDLAGFTSLMESADPANAVALLNDYLDAMLAIVFKHEGTLDRIVGDAVAVLFSAPMVQADHRQRALRCALEMDVFATAYARQQQAAGVAWGITRIGVHSGEVIVGNFGGKTLFDYRALGDPINTAARLESVNKHLGTRVCISQAIVDDCPDVPARAVGRLVLKGKQQALQVYEPLACTDAPACAAPAAYAEAMHLLQPGEGSVPAQAERACEAFAALAERHPRDPLVALHLRRLREGASDDLIVMSAK
jgi:adenylate cyclase